MTSSAHCKGHRTNASRNTCSNERNDLNRQDARAIADDLLYHKFCVRLLWEVRIFLGKGAVAKRVESVGITIRHSWGLAGAIRILIARCSGSAWLAQERPIRFCELPMKPRPLLGQRSHRRALDGRLASLGLVCMRVFRGGGLDSDTCPSCQPEAHRTCSARSDHSYRSQYASLSEEHHSTTR